MLHKSKPFTKHAQEGVPRKLDRTQQKPSRHPSAMAKAVESLSYMHETQSGQTTKNFRVPRKDD